MLTITSITAGRFISNYDARYRTTRNYKDSKIGQNAAGVDNDRWN
jgi:hypothetical protein